VWLSETRLGDAERKAIKYYKRLGWTVHRLGALDLFLARKKGKRTVVAFREVKGSGDILRGHQIEILKALREAGLDAKILWTETMTETNETEGKPDIEPGFLFTMRMPPEFKRRLCRIATREGRSNSDVIRRALERYAKVA